jgi:hypothetical protein
MYTTNDVSDVSGVQNFIARLGVYLIWQQSLFKSIDECQSFYRHFYKRNPYLIDDLLDYREYKLSILNIFLKKHLKI